MDPRPAKSFVFNYYGASPPSTDDLYLYTNLPAVQLVPREQEQNDPELIQRNASQQAALLKKGISVANSWFGDSLDWKYRTYFVYPLSPGDSNLLTERSPHGGFDRAALDRTTASIQVRERQPSETDWRICLFNVIVALEWEPDADYLRQLEWAFSRASDMLYDVTDGVMAFGQVVFANHELMDCADIQIMASNRILPRSWVSGLNKPEKYQPIRMGRGVWHDRNQVTIPWEEPEGYRTIVHEWGHYALALRDKYIEARPFKGGASAQSGTDNQDQVTVPKRRLTSVSIMETLEGTSELVSQVSTHHQQIDEAWKTIDGDYSWLRPQQTRDMPTQAGPRQLPLPLPQFVYYGMTKPAEAIDPPNKALISSEAMHKLQDPIKPSGDSGYPSRCWAYVLTPSQTGEHKRLIAQGTLDARSWDSSFELLGATPGSKLYVFAEPHDQAPRTFLADISADEQGQLVVGAWQERNIDHRHIIDVIPLLPEEIPSLSQAERDAYSHAAGPFYVSVRIQNVEPDLALTATLFPQGQTTSQHANSAADAPPFELVRLSPEEAGQLGLSGDSDWVSSPVKLPTLDGHVLVEFEHPQQGNQVLISTFSQGGGPQSHTGIPSNPITAGSSDGTAMLFFNPATDTIADKRYGEHYKMVTNTIHGVQPADPSGQEVRSSVYSIAANRPLPRELGATLVIYFDTTYQDDSGDLRLYCLKAAERWDDQAPWQQLFGEVSPSDRFVTIPLGGNTISVDGSGTRLVEAQSSGVETPADGAASPRTECFRLFGAPFPPGAE